MPNLHQLAAPPAGSILAVALQVFRHEWQPLLTCVHTLPAGLIRLFVVLDTNILLTRFWHAQKVLEVLAAAARTLVEVAFVVPWVSQWPWSFPGHCWFHGQVSGLDRSLGTVAFVFPCCCPPHTGIDMAWVGQ